MTIYEALRSLNLPVCHPPYKGDAETYITYQLLGQIGQIYAEGKEAETAVSYAVDIFSTFFNASLFVQVKQLLEAAGYVVTVDMEYYNQEKDISQMSLLVAIEGGQYG